MPLHSPFVWENVLSPEPLIREAQPGDESGIHEAHMRSIREVCIRDHSEEEISGWGNHPLGDRWIAQIQESGVWVIELDGVIRGVGYIQTRHKTHEREAHLFALYLAPEALGKGLAGRLLQLLLNKARSDGARVVTLVSTLTAHGFYKRFGFVDSGPMKLTKIGGVQVRGVPMALKLL